VREEYLYYFNVLDAAYLAHLEKKRKK